MNEIIEIARFRVDAESEDSLMAAWRPMAAAMRRTHPGLQAVSLVRFSDGTWADIAVWADRRSADLACSTGPYLPEVEAFFAQIAEDVSMDLVSVVDTAEWGTHREGVDLDKS